MFVCVCVCVCVRAGGALSLQVLANNVVPDHSKQAPS